MSRQRRFVSMVGLAAVAMLATACPSPPGGGGGPTWSAHGIGAPESGGVTPRAAAVGTTDDWYVEVAENTGTQPDGLSFYPRVGINGNDLGTPQTFATGFTALDLGELSDNLYVSETQQLGDRLLQFYAESGGTWTTAGTMLLSIYSNVLALTDDTMAVVTVDPTEVDPSTVELFDLSVVGGVVTATLNTTLTAPPSWGAAYQTTFGRSEIALEGDVLAIAGSDYWGTGPYRVGVYRKVGGVWVFEDEMSGGPDHKVAYVSVDDMGSSERLAIGATSTTSTGVIDLHVSSGGSWNLETQLDPPTGVVDDANGELFGYGVVLDGNLLVTGIAQENLPPESGWPNRYLYHSSVFHLSAGVWSYETRLTGAAGPIAPTDVGVTTRLTHVAGNHVVGSNLITTTACSSPCVVFRFESWRFDRTPLP